jgi:hypothetical protein
MAGIPVWRIPKAMTAKEKSQRISLEKSRKYLTNASTCAIIPSLNHR